MGPVPHIFSDNADTNRLGLVACGRLVGGRGGVERTGTFFIVAPVLETVPIVPVHFLANSGRIGLVALRGSEHTGTFSIVAPFLETVPIVPVHIFVKFWQNWHGVFEREAPEAGAILFAPSVKDAVAIRMDDQDSMLGENHLAAKIGKGAQADKGMGEGGHNMPLHSRWWEGWGRG